MSRIHESITVDGEVVKTSILVDEIEAKPIGIGYDKFHIDEGFMIMVREVYSFKNHILKSIRN